MANTVCTSFKEELMSGEQNLANGGGTFKLALYSSSSSINSAATAIYTTSDEVANGIVFAIQNDFVTGTTVDVDGGWLLS